jgi:integrase/recombinase XerD
MGREKRCLKLAEWPPRDRAAWSRAISPGVAFDDDGAACHLSESTRRLALKGHGHWLHFLKRKGQLSPDVSPASRATSQLVSDYVAEVAARCNVHTASIYLRSLGVALRVLDPLGNREAVITHARQLARSAEAMCSDRDVLVSASQLFEAGMARMEKCACNVRREAKLIAMRYGDGLMLAIEACKPLRLRNLRDAEIGRNLVFEGGQFWLRFSKAETKTSQTIEAMLPDELTPFIETWLSVHRPILLDGRTSERLWITMWGTSISSETLYQRFCKATHAELGVRLNPHAARRVVATSIAIAMPEQVEMIPFLLDHRTEKTAQKHYNKARSLSASARYLGRFKIRRRLAINKMRRPRR